MKNDKTLDLVANGLIRAAKVAYPEFYVPPPDSKDCSEFFDPDTRQGRALARVMALNNKPDA